MFAASKPTALKATTTLAALSPSIEVVTVAVAIARFCAVTSTSPAAAVTVLPKMLAVALLSSVLVAITPPMASSAATSLVSLAISVARSMALTVTSPWATTMPPFSSASAPPVAWLREIRPNMEGPDSGSASASGSSAGAIVAIAPSIRSVG